MVVFQISSKKIVFQKFIIMTTRTSEQLKNQAETMLMLVYEQVNNINLNGFPPKLPANYPPMQKALKECKRIAEKYKDQELLSYYQMNY